MKKRGGQLLLIACITAFAALIFLKPQYGVALRMFLAGERAAATGTAPDLAAENEVLKSQLAELQAVAAQLPAAPSHYLRAMVYSRYPLNFKNEILVNVGSNNGIAAGDAVIFRGILVGAVEKVFPGSALVQTVFDDHFKIPVRVGPAGNDGLFVGGTSPRVASIAKTAKVSLGDIVYAAGEGTPYGLPMALVASTSTSPDGLFEEAGLRFAYDVNTLQTVLVAQ